MGWPVPAHIDPELTPPPQDPPRPESLEDYDTIAPPIREQLDMLATHQRELTSAISRNWGAQVAATQLDRIDQKLSDIATSVTRHQTLLDENLVPQLDRWRAATDELTRQLPRITAAVEGLTLMVNAIDLRQRNLELEFRTAGVRVDGSIHGMTSRLDSHAAEISTHATRITALETNNRDEVVASNAITKRDKKLIGWAAGAGAVIAFVVSQLKTIIGWFH